MSETTDQRRSRRRASRSAGPPVGEGPAAGTSPPDTVTTDSGSANEAGSGATSAASAPRVSVAKTAAPSASESGSASEKTIPANGLASGEQAETVKIVSADDDVTRGDTTASDRPDKTAEHGNATDNAAKPGGGPPSRLLRKKAGKGSADDAADTGVVVTETVADEPEPDTTDKTAKSGKSTGRILASIAAAVIALALVSAAVLSVFAVQSAEERDAHRAEYLQTARQTIINLTTIRADSAEEDIDRILTMASGEFKTEFDGRVDPFTEIIKQANVVSNGEVIEAAIENEHENSAQILVAAKQTLTNAGQEEPQQRYYRFRVTVTRTDDGSLSVSDVEFVA
ncbi:hypothetical protein [Nocardia donostiensis]|uniref:hypothetical protein n=1 Tax=Nocardia donostiensis TaxID=1538463 RepID=UPI0009D92C0F|nr:hypothetical protein [Nocardia donostiensis]